jgi:hypothetical protein
MNVKLRLPQHVHWGFSSSGLSGWVSGLVIPNVLKECTTCISTVKESLKSSRHGRQVETYRSSGPILWDR